MALFIFVAFMIATYYILDKCSRIKEKNDLIYKQKKEALMKCNRCQFHSIKCHNKKSAFYGQITGARFFCKDIEIGLEGDFLRKQDDSDFLALM